MLTGFSPGCFFEVDSFSFGAGAPPKERNGAAPGELAKPPLAYPGAGTGARGGPQPPRDGKALSVHGDLHPVSFSRSIDMSSTTLIQNCINTKVYNRATLIKRKAAGTKAAGEVFLRLDFIGVLVTQLGWSDDVEVAETCTFIARGVNMTYRPQLPSGKLGFPISVYWSMTPGESQPPLA